MRKMWFASILNLQNKDFFPEEKDEEEGLKEKKCNFILAAQ